MIRLSKKVEYGLIAIRHIATKPLGEIVTAKEIAETYGIPYELLSKVLQKLTKSGLISSHQGMRGGYALARPPVEIPVSRGAATDRSRLSRLSHGPPRRGGEPGSLLAALQRGLFR